MAQYRSLRYPPRRTVHRSSARYIVTVVLTTAVVATGGFGAFPDNPITNTVQEEIGKNVPAAILQPVNSYLEQLSAPTIQPQYTSQANPPLDLLGLLIDAPTDVRIPGPGTQPSNSETLISQFTETATLTPTEITHTVTPSRTATVTSTPTASQTPTLTATQACLTPSSTLVDVTFFNSSSQTIDIYWVDFSCQLVFYSTLNPGQSYVQSTYIGHVWWFIDSSTGHLLATHTISSANEVIDVSTGVVAGVTATPTPTITDTPIPVVTTAIPLGFYVSAVNLNGSGSVITVSPGTFVMVTYNFQVFSGSYCPTCISQLVTGLGSVGTHGGACAYHGIPPLFPGTTGSENVTLTAPSTLGTYSVVVEYHWQYTCADALTIYGGGGAVRSQIIGQIIVQ